MKQRIILTALMFALINVVVYAKSSKLKFDKQLIFEGEIINKIPSGEGILQALDPKSKSPFCTISGDFDGFEAVNNPNIYLEGLGKLSTNGTAKLVINNKKPYNFEIDLSGTKFTLGSTTYTINNLCIKIYEGKDSWNIISTFDKPSWMNQNLFENIIENLENIKESQNRPTHIIFYGDTDSEALKNGSELGYKVDKQTRVFALGNSSEEAITSDVFLLSKPGDNPYRFIYTNNMLYDTKYPITKFMLPVAKIKTDGTWEGVIISECRDNAIVIIKESACKPEVKITSYPNIDINNPEYFGTIKDVNKSVTAGFNACSIAFENGIQIINDKKEKWINSVSETDIKNQLSKKGVESDLIDSVISGEISYESAISQQSQREEQKKIFAEKMRKEFAKHWTGTEVLFTGSIKGTIDGNKILGLFYGLDNSYIEGEAGVYLNNSGEARLLIGALPSKKALSQGRAVGLQVLGICKTINKEMSGTWSIEGNQLLINGENYSISFSPDFKTLTYKGMVGATMKIKK